MREFVMLAVSLVINCCVARLWYGVWEHNWFMAFMTVFYPVLTGGLAMVWPKGVDIRGENEVHLNPGSKTKMSLWLHRNRN